MTDDRATPTSDELASADLDGEATPGEHARVEADAGLRARREEMRSAAAAIGAPVPPLPPSVVDQLVRRAIDEADEPAAVADPPPGPADRSPDPLATAGRSASVVGGEPAVDSVRALPRRSPRRGPPPFLVAAAVVALVAIGLGLIFTSRSPKQSSQAGKSTAGDIDQKSAGAGGSAADRGRDAPAPDATGGPSVEPSSPPVERDLGEFASADALRQALRARFPAPAGAGEQNPRAVTSFSQTQVDRCTSVVEARDDRLQARDRLHVAAATIRDVPVLVLEYRTRAIVGKRVTSRVVAVGVAACEDQLNFER